MKNFTQIIFVIFLFISTQAQAEVDFQFKNLPIQKKGSWQSETVITEGSLKGQKISQTHCVDSDKSAAYVDAMQKSSKMFTNCKTTVTKDTKEVGEFIQECVVGPSKIKSYGSTRKISDTVFKSEISQFTNGTLQSKSVTTSTFKGPCTTKDEPNASENCQQCKAEIAKMKSGCEKYPEGPQKQMCTNMVRQFESTCSVSCKQ